MFDEELGLLIDRVKGMGIDLAAMWDAGEPLAEFQGVLRGVPTYVGKSAPLMEAP